MVLVAMQVGRDNKGLSRRRAGRSGGVAARTRRGGLPAGGELAGEALLWAIDLHNRIAHLGVSLRPAFRGRGLGADVVVALCEYGFAVRGLHRLQVDTLAGNTAMIRAAERAGFVPEGRLRQAAWAGGDFAEVVILGLLAAGWDGGRRHPGEVGG
jgi:RimJ/RimL family protein N-acetyltransferase